MNRSRVLLLLAAPLLVPTASSSAQTLVQTLDDPIPQFQAFFGGALANVGDVSGDGVPDLAVGAVNQEVDGQREVGRAFVFSGATGALLLTLDNPDPQRLGLSGFGGAVAGVQDINRDGVPDLAVGAYQARVNGLFDQGQVFIFSGATGAPLLTLDNPSPQGDAIFGLSVAGVQDVNRDGVPDVAVGAYRQDVGGILNQGQAFVFSGATGALLLTLDNPAPQRNSGFGRSVSGIGDVDGDGAPDLAVGAFLQNVVEIAQGQAFVFSGASGALLLTLNDPEPQINANLGSSIAALGDVNGDGVPDLALGAPSKDVDVGDGNVTIAQGQVLVFSGATGDLLHTLNHPIPQSAALFGAPLAALGDTDGDGIPALAVAAIRQDVGDTVKQGQVFVFSWLSATLDKLFACVEDLDTSNQVKNGLLGKLREAKKALERGKTCVALNKLEDFRNQVAGQAGNAISESDAAFLDTCAVQVIERLEPLCS